MVHSIVLSPGPNNKIPLVLCNNGMVDRIPEWVWLSFHNCDRQWESKNSLVMNWWTYIDQTIETVSGLLLYKVTKGTICQDYCLYHVPEDIFLTKFTTLDIMDVTGITTWFGTWKSVIILQCHLKFISTSMYSELTEKTMESNSPALIGAVRSPKKLINLWVCTITFIYFPRHQADDRAL